MDFKKLTEPFPFEDISWRIGPTRSDKSQGIALGYINSRSVMNRLDEVCGPENWQIEHYDCGNGKLGCKIGIYFEETKMWVWKSDGAGDTDVEKDKGAFSDAVKRAAVAWGIGRDLYNLKNLWVLIEPSGKSFVIKESEKAKLKKSYESLVFGKATRKAKPESEPEPTTGSIVDELINQIKSKESIEDLQLLAQTALKAKKGSLNDSEIKILYKAYEEKSKQLGKK